MFRTSPSARPERLMLAMEGDRWSGTTLLLHQEGGRIYIWLTGVEPDCRGKGVALGLKARSIQYALENGATEMTTHNLSTNQPMLAVNRRLGYQPLTGLWMLRKDLSLGT